MTARSYGRLVIAADDHPQAWQEFPKLFKDLEDGGCDAIWLADHLLSGYQSGDALVLAGIAAASTTTCHIGTGVLQLPLRRTAALAKATATIQLVSRGRFLLGVGVGHHRREFEAAGVPFGRRGHLVDQTLDDLHDLWRRDDGWFSQSPTPPSIPIVVGGHSDAALRRATAAGTGWMPLFLSAQRYAERSVELDDLLAATDRPPVTVSRGVTLFVAVTDSRWRRDDAVSWATRLFPAAGQGIDRHILTGTVAECVEQIRTFERAGACHVVIYHARPNSDALFADLLGELRSHCPRQPS